MSIPHHTRASVSITLAVSGVLGMIYSTISIRRMHRLVRYEPVAEDWLCVRELSAPNAMYRDRRSV